MKLFSKIKKKITNFESRLPGTLLGIILIIVYFFMKKYYLNANGKSFNNISFTDIWLEMSLFFALIAVIFIFLILFKHLRKGAKDKNNLYRNLSKKEQKRVGRGITLASISVPVLLLIIILCFLNIIPLFGLQIISIIFAVIALIIDYLLHCKKETLTFDFVIFIGLLITLSLSIIFKMDYISFSNKLIFIHGFTAGSTAFQIFIASLYFDPKEYSIESIFKLKN